MRTSRPCRLSLAAAVTLSAACSQQPAPLAPSEPWPSEAEAIFQQREVLRHSLEESGRDQAELEALQVEGQAPLFPY